MVSKLKKTQKPALKKYRSKILKGSGPILIEAITFRVRGHEEASGIKYVPKKIIEDWKKKDPILKYESYILKNKIIDKKYNKSLEYDI